jgi:glycine hydroxymethyltransferase
LATALLAEGVTLVTGGTDNHLLVIDTMASFGLDGRAAEEALDAIGVTANKQIIPDDPRPPLRPSGLRLGTPACTTRGMNEEDMMALVRTAWTQHSRWQIGRTTELTSADENGRTLQGPAL